MSTPPNMRDTLHVAYEALGRWLNLAPVIESIIEPLDAARIEIDGHETKVQVSLEHVFLPAVAKADDLSNDA